VVGKEKSVSLHFSSSHPTTPDDEKIFIKISVMWDAGTDTGEEFVSLIRRKLKAILAYDPNATVCLRRV
jgi:hypothetical protein